MATALENELMEQMKVCMKSGDKIGLAAVRMVRTKVMEKRTAKNATEVTDEVVVDVIRNYVKVLQSSIDELKAGGASEEEENIAQMLAEIQYLARFLPQHEHRNRFLRNGTRSRDHQEHDGPHRGTLHGLLVPGSGFELPPGASYEPDPGTSQEMHALEPAEAAPAKEPSA